MWEIQLKREEESNAADSGDDENAARDVCGELGT